MAADKAIRYLSNVDYDMVIQSNQLGQLLQNSQNKLLKAEQYAEAEVSSYLIQKFDMSYEFTNTGTFSMGITYSAHDRVILDYPIYSTSNTYNLNQLTVYNGSTYVLTGATSTTGTFSTTNWTYVGEQYDMFYVAYPEPLFDYMKDYAIDDLTYWKGYTYSCVVATSYLNDTNKNQYLQWQNIPYKNIFPNSALNKQNQYWMPGSTQSYKVPQGTLPNDTQYWIAGDNRSQIIVNYMVDMVLYQISKSIAANNIPELRKDAYKRACEWLNKMAMGNLTLDTLMYQPKTGMIIRGSGNTKNPTQW